MLTLAAHTGAQTLEYVLSPLSSHFLCPIVLPPNLPPKPPLSVRAHSLHSSLCLCRDSRCRRPYTSPQPFHVLYRIKKRAESDLCMRLCMYMDVWLHVNNEPARTATYLITQLQPLETQQIFNPAPARDGIFSTGAQPGWIFITSD